MQAMESGVEKQGEENPAYGAKWHFCGQVLTAFLISPQNRMRYVAIHDFLLVPSARTSVRLPFGLLSLDVSYRDGTGGCG